MGTLMPMLAYADAPAAIDFLCQAFGFEVAVRMDGPDGSVGHAELSLNGGVLSVATVWREGGFSTPEELSGVHSQVWCDVGNVDDIDAHFVRARAAGAVVLGEPVDQEHGYRTYRAIDAEGHRWYFAGRIGS